MNERRYLDALARPFEQVLLPLGYQRVACDDNLRGLSVLWASPRVVVQASYEPPETWGDVTIGRRMKGTSPDDQPYWSMALLAEILRLRDAGAMPSGPRGRDRIFAMPEDVAAWAVQAAERLAGQADLLRGENLEVIDQVIAELPRVGVPGFDYPE